MKSKWLPSSLTLGIIFSFLFVSNIFAQDRKIEQAIKHRQGAFTVMSTYWSRLLQTYEGNRPYDAKATIADAKVVEYMSRLPWEGFVPGSEVGNTKAKEDIWLDEEKFHKLARELETKTTALTKAAETNDVKKFKVAFENARDTCSACHKEFRRK